ncbi:MAG: hypothetical protein ABI851_11375 [Saprospiraceae bacterium]
MNNFVFKIFGAPHIFDLYQGNEAEIGYFQNFYNGGKENVKLTIHRMMSGKVSYSYLRYNFISSSGRPNSFFGMSVLFDKEYCKDFKKIFELFNVIYKDIILQNGILLTELKDNPTAQAKYYVQTFAEADGEVKNIENNIINNLKNYFNDDILPIDHSFLESNSMVNLNDQLDNSRYVNALRNFTWVHISPEYSKNEDPIPNDEFLSNLDDTIEKVRHQITKDALSGINVQGEAKNYLDKTNASLGKIYTWLEDEYKMQKGVNPNSYLQKQPKLKERYDKLLEIQKPLNGIKSIETNTPTQIPVSLFPLDTNPEPPNPSPESELSPENLLYYWQKYKLTIIVVAVVVMVALISVIIFNLGGKAEVKTPIENMRETTTPGKSIDELIKLGNQALGNNDFDTAITNFEKAAKIDLVSLAKSKAIEYWNGKAAIAMTPHEAIDCLKNTEKYGNNPTVDIEEYQKKINNKIDDDKRKRQLKENRLKKKQEVVQPQQQTTQTYPDAVISITNNKRRYSKDEKLIATAKSGATIFTGGEWKFEDGLYANKNENPTEVRIVNVPSNGKAILRYYLGNKQMAAITINISQ